ncbi:MAG: LysM peptidoglycan-binding domain-containing protein [Bacilli bacterium]|nr:LysM peptidoglycan-binding domain-containing protein [Bacilli bacterium]
MIIDVSHHQPPSKIDYDMLANQVKFVIIRTQYGSNVIDRHYKTHHREFQKRGIPTAAYAFVRGKTIADMKKEAELFYERTKPFQPTFWFLDVEERSMNDMRAGIKAYADTLRALGVEKIGVYIAHHFYRQFNIDVNDFDAIWLPHYGKNNGTATSKPSFPCDIHQYTDRGRLKGYDGFLDLNRIVSDKPLAYFTARKDAAKLTANHTDLTFKTYTVKRGDTLWHIAKRHGTTVADIVKWNRIKNPHIIYPGDKLRLPAKTHKSKYYIVKKGDTLSHIAKKHDTSVKRLVELNHIDNPHLIYPGQKIRIN